MKNSNTLLTIVLSIVLFGAISCQSSSSENLEDAKTEANKADENLSEAREEYLADMKNYKNEVGAKIIANEQSIKEFKARVAQSENKAKGEYEKKINDLEQKNAELKRKLDEYKLDGKEQWNAFKAEFSRDMDELGKALKDLTIDNK